MAGKVVKEGNKIKIHYTGKLDDGKVFDSSEGREPLEFTVGEGKIIKGLDAGVRGMKEGEEKDVKIKSEDAYGERREELMQEIPRDKLPKEPEPKKGMVLQLKNPAGQVFLARIADVSGNSVKIDLNHPLAGQNLNFKVKIVKIA